MANDALCQMTGYRKEEIEQLSVRDIHPPDALADVLETFAKQAQGHLRLSRNIPVQTKDGTVVYCDVNAIPLAMDGKNYVLGVFRDVTEQRTLSERLRESEELYKTLVESAGESIARVDTEGRFLFLNKTAAFRLGGEPRDFLGRKIQDLFPPDIAERQATGVREVIKTGRGKNVVAPTVLRGQTRWYNTTVEPLADANGDITSALIVSRDIHDLREAQRELEEYRSQMARAEQLASLGTLSATVAHELNQPLTVIQLTLQNCLAQLEEGGPAQQAMADVQECLQEVSAASAIVDRFKGFARQSRGRRITWVNLDNTARKVIRTWAEAAEESGLSLEARGLQHLPELRMHERDIEQLFFALLENAIQAANPHRNQHLLITATAKDNTVELRFADNCGGIAPENLDKIFHPFFTTKTNAGGTGLGLGIVEHVVQRAHGKVTVDNRPGQGVTFIITLPLPD
jgi:PAS domain S-box-containing protein